MLIWDLVLGSVTGTYYGLFQKEIRKIPIVTPSLFNQNYRITTHHISNTRFKSVIKNGHNWSPASNVLGGSFVLSAFYADFYPGLATYFRFSFRFFKKGSCQLLAKVCARSTGLPLRRSKPAQEKCG